MTNPIPGQQLTPLDATERLAERSTNLTRQAARETGNKSLSAILDAIARETAIALKSKRKR